MEEKTYLLVTNNRKALDKYGNHVYIGVEYLEEGDYLAVLIRVRDRIHRGWHLLTHPQASNLKPLQCPYKTILISKGRAAQGMERDIELIENSIAAYHKFTKGMTPPNWTEKALLDFQTVDLSVVDSAVESPLMQQMLYEKPENQSKQEVY